MRTSIIALLLLALTGQAAAEEKVQVDMMVLVNGVQGPPATRNPIELNGLIQRAISSSASFSTMIKNVDAPRLRLELSINETTDPNVLAYAYAVRMLDANGLILGDSDLKLGLCQVGQYVPCAAAVMDRLGRSAERLQHP